MNNRKYYIVDKTYGVVKDLYNNETKYFDSVSEAEKYIGFLKQNFYTGPFMIIDNWKPR